MTHARKIVIRLARVNELLGEISSQKDAINGWDEIIIKPGEGTLPKIGAIAV